MMSEKVLEGTYEQPQHGERYFPSMPQALEFCQWIDPIALAINPVNILGEQMFQLIYQYNEGNR